MTKKLKAFNIISRKPTISSEDLAENANVCIKKLKYSEQETEQHLKNLIRLCQIVLVDESIILAALYIHHRPGYSFYDTQIITAALEHNCTILYSEDLQHNHQLTVG